MNMSVIGVVMLIKSYDSADESNHTHRCTNSGELRDFISGFRKTGRLSSGNRASTVVKKAVFQSEVEE